MEGSHSLPLLSLKSVRRNVKLGIVESGRAGGVVLGLTEVGKGGGNELDNKGGPLETRMERR